MSVTKSEIDAVLSHQDLLVVHSSNSNRPVVADLALMMAHLEVHHGTWERVKWLCSPDVFPLLVTAMTMSNGQPMLMSDINGKNSTLSGVTLEITSFLYNKHCPLLLVDLSMVPFVNLSHKDADGWQLSPLIGLAMGRQVVEADEPVHVARVT